MLRSLQVENIRSIEAACLELGPAASGIVGANGAGKTSILEAVFLLGHGRSFRTHLREQVIRHGCPEARVTARIVSDGREHPAGMEFGRKRLVSRLDAQDASVIDIARLLPIQVIDPGIHCLVEEGSLRRRRLLDWGVFHVKHDFLGRWRQYHRALEQRNAALRSGQLDTLEAWDRAMAPLAEQIDVDRREYAASLGTTWRRISAEILGVVPDIEYQRGWAPGDSLDQCLRDRRARDVRLKMTTTGPHRADLRLLINGVPAKEVVSRGQQKLLAASLVLAQLEMRAEEGVHTLLLFDDPAAELDVDNLGKLLAVVRRIGCQILATGLDVSALSLIQPERLFHVEQGKVSRML